MSSVAHIAGDRFAGLESRLFNQVLNLYVAASEGHFISAALALLQSDGFCDFAIALARHAGGDSFVAHGADGPQWEPAFVQRQAALSVACRAGARPGRKLAVVRGGPAAPAAGAAGHYRTEVMTRLGSGQAALLFVGGRAGESAILLSAHRRPGAPEFEDRVLDQLESCRGYIENAWSLLSQRMFSRVLLDGISDALRSHRHGVVMLDRGLRVVWHNRAARESVCSWGEGGRARTKPGRNLARLPAEIIQACERLRGEWRTGASRDRSRRSEVVRHAAATGQAATVRLRGVRHAGIDSPSFLISFEQNLDGSAAAKRPVARSLTATEWEVAALVRQGMSNQEIASALGKSVAAVKFHLHRMFRKAAVTTRSRLMLALA